MYQFLQSISITMLLKELEGHVDKETSRLSEKQDAEKVELRAEVENYFLYQTKTLLLQLKAEVENTLKTIKLLKIMLSREKEKSLQWSSPGEGDVREARGKCDRAVEEEQ